MKLLSALFDAALLPLDVAKDLVMFLPRKASYLDDWDSDTRRRIEKIEEELR